jgi:uncharacterized membrane protein
MGSSVASASSTSYTPLSEGTGATRRITSLDVARGLAMVLMAIDHVRVYSGVPAGAPIPSIFFTRWITHFVAPAFAFFAGTSIYLHARKLGSPNATSRFLVTRGAWLILLELTVIRVCWTFNFDFRNYMLAGVIWMLGWCMILMAGFSRLSLRTNAIAGGAIVALHNLFDFAPDFGQSFGPVWALLYGGSGSVVNLVAPLFILYVIVPWIGVMMLGFAFGAVMTKTPAERKRLVLRIGMYATAAFVVLRSLDVYGDPRHWRSRPAPAVTASQAATTSGAQASPPARPQAPATIRFLNTSKYPASLLFLLMTLGPMLLVLGAVDGRSGAVTNVLATYGRVPFFYYLLHIPLIHAAALIVSVIREGQVNPWLFTNLPVAPGDLPDGYMWPLWLLYLVFAICVAILYSPCRWFARVRASGKHPLLTYL